MTKNDNVPARATCTPRCFSLLPTTLPILFPSPHDRPLFTLFPAVNVLPRHLATSPAHHPAPRPSLTLGGSVPDYRIKHCFFFFCFADPSPLCGGIRTALIASSKTFFRPFCLKGSVPLTLVARCGPQGESLLEVGMGVYAVPRAHDDKGDTTTTGCHSTEPSTPSPQRRPIRA